MSTCKGLSENECRMNPDCMVVSRGKTTYCRLKPKKNAPPPIVQPVQPVPAPFVQTVPAKPLVIVEPIVKPIVKPIVEPIVKPIVEPTKPVPIIKDSDSESDAESQIENDESLVCLENEFSEECNKIKIKKELKEAKYESETENTYLYPNLNDPNFNIKIATKQEFNDTKYDGTIHSNVKKQAEMLSNADFELSPHQAFVKNFLSFQTPYNSLLLYHGLGSGKTCSAIGVCEEMRDYLKQMNITKRIIIVASENVQENFRLQLFDEKKLKETNGVWNITNCIGNKILREINSTNLTREKITSEVNNIIDNSYLFIGYIAFSNYILKKAGTGDVKTQKERLQREFDNRLIVIDEVHNIRVTDNNEENKLVASNLEKLVTMADNLRLLLLSATPMFNTYKEIIWLLNLMNMNDRRSTISHSDIFDALGNFKKKGREILIRKATGYVSFVRGENPYTFPYRVYPKDFSFENTFFDKKNKYPTIQMNGIQINPDNELKIIDVYLGKIGPYQSRVYKYITTRQKGALKKNIGYTLLQLQLQSLIITYPHDELDRAEATSSAESESESEATSSSIPSSIESESEATSSSSPSSSESKSESEATSSSSPSSIESDATSSSSPSSTESEAESIIQKGGAVNINELTGEKGLERIMIFKNKSNYEYKPEFEAKYNRIFSLSEIGKYSFKIEAILNSIIQSKGIILIYSQYIDSGLIPMALALEELGFTKFDGKSLLKTNTDLVTNEKNDKKQKYAMITGDKILSPDNISLVKELTDKKNKNGERIKVILVSRAGTEGIDLKFIRQVHILEPWYNMNRIEQIIGRAVRNFSHKDLPFEERNVQIYLYGTLLENEEEEAVDLYVYRTAERKSIKIGKVSRILKETAVDCIINHGQTNFTQEMMNDKIEGTITQHLSNGMELTDFKIGDQPYSSACDYMENCQYDCTPSVEVDEYNLNEDTYNESYIMINSERINQKIKMLFKENFFYVKKKLLQLIDVPKKYPLVQKYAALTVMINNREPIIDKYGRIGYLINIGEYYLFQPKELLNHHASIFERTLPIDHKHKSIEFTITHDPVKEVVDKRHLDKNEMTAPVPTVASSSEFNELKTIYESFLEYKKDPTKKIPKDTEDSWYLYYGVVMNKIRTEFLDLIQRDIQTPITEETLIEYFIEHMFDVIPFQEKYSILNYLYSLEEITENSFEMLAKEYFIRHSLTIRKSKKTITVLLLYDNLKETENDVVVMLTKKKWDEVGLETKREILESQEATSWHIDKNELSYIIGFIGYDKKKKIYVFKTKVSSMRKGVLGARCDQAVKNIQVENLNKIIGVPELFNKVNTKKTSGVEICILQEIILRHYNSIRRNEKKWFISSDIALYNKY